MIVSATSRWTGPWLATLLVALLALGLTACGSSGNGSSGNGSPSPSASASTAPNTADAATLSAITKAYETFFAPNSTAAQVQSVIQNGAMFASTISSEGSSKYSGKSGVKIDSVQLQSSDVAKVTFSVTVNGAVLLPDASGYAVLDHRTWKMAANTFCQLLTLEGTAPKTCSQPSATALPSP